MSEEVKQQVKQALDEVASLPADKRDALSQIAEVFASGLAAGLSIAAQGRTPAGDTAERKE